MVIPEYVIYPLQPLRSSSQALYTKTASGTISRSQLAILKPERRWVAAARHCGNDRFKTLSVLAEYTLTSFRQNIPA